MVERYFGGVIAISNVCLSAIKLKRHLESCGYSESRLATDYRFNDHTLPLVGFADQPWDARSACIAVVDLNGNPRDTVTGSAGCSSVPRRQTRLVEGDNKRSYQARNLSARPDRPIFQGTQVGFCPGAYLPSKNRGPLRYRTTARLC